MAFLDDSPSSSSCLSVRDVDPLLKDLNEKKQTFRRSVLSLTEELKEVRSRLASQEQSYAHESVIRKVAETKAKNMEVELQRLQKRLEERYEQLQASSSTADKYLNELDDLRSQLAATQAAAKASAESAESAQLQGLVLLKELDDKNRSLQTQEDQVIRLAQQLENLRKDLQTRESSQKQLRDEVSRIEHDIIQAVAKAQASGETETMKLFDKDKVNKLLIKKDEEIAKLKDEIRIMSAHWKHKTKDLESQLEKQRRADQELKKKVLKLDFCLQEARAQTKKLQRTGERRDKALKELKDQLAAKQQGDDFGKPKFWESSGFKIVVSMSMVVLVMFSRDELRSSCRG